MAYYTKSYDSIPIKGMHKNRFTDLKVIKSGIIAMPSPDKSYSNYQPA